MSQGYQPLPKSRSLKNPPQGQIWNMSSSQVLDPTVLSTEEKPLVIRQEGRKEIDVVAHIDATNERLARIEEQLDILTLEPVFEEEFEELREAKKAYDEVLNRLRTFNALRGSR